MKPKHLTRPWSRPREVRTKCERMEDRPTSAPLYHTARWTRESKAFKEQHPLCIMCLDKGIYTPSEVTDHIIPYPLHDFWDSSNWQALCYKCNIIKGNKDKTLINNRGRGV